LLGEIIAVVANGVESLSSWLRGIMPENKSRIVSVKMLPKKS